MARTDLLRPSATAAGSAWLGQFYLKDRATAEFLLDSMKMVNESQYFGSMAELIAWRMEGLDPRTTAIVARGYSPSSGAGARPTTYDEVGSEEVALVVARAATRRHGTLTAWSLDALRLNRVRDVLLIDDLVGSGRSTLKGLRQWTDSRTIRSWMSFGLLRLHVLGFAGTDRGVQAVRNQGFEVDCFDRACDINAALRRSPRFSRDRVDELLLGYGIARARHGYGNAEALVIIEHTVPNSLPSVFLQRRGNRRQQWTPLFDRHTYVWTGDVDRSKGYRPAEPVVDSVLLEHPHIDPSWAARQTTLTLHALLAASLIVLRGMEERDVCRVAHLSPGEFRAARSAAGALGLLDGKKLARQLRVLSTRTAPARYTPASEQGAYFPNFRRPVG